MSTTRAAPCPSVPLLAPRDRRAAERRGRAGVRRRDVRRVGVRLLRTAKRAAARARCGGCGIQGALIGGERVRRARVREAVAAAARAREARRRRRRRRCLCGVPVVRVRMLGMRVLGVTLRAEARDAQAVVLVLRPHLAAAQPVPMAVAPHAHAHVRRARPVEAHHDVVRVVRKLVDLDVAALHPIRVDLHLDLHHLPFPSRTCARARAVKSTKPLCAIVVHVRLARAVGDVALRVHALALVARARRRRVPPHTMVHRVVVVPAHVRDRRERGGRVERVRCGRVRV